MAIFTFPLYTPPIAIRSLPASRLELFFTAVPRIGRGRRGSGAGILFSRFFPSPICIRSSYGEIISLVVLFDQL